MDSGFQYFVEITVLHHNYYFFRFKLLLLNTLISRYHFRSLSTTLSGCTHFRGGCFLDDALTACLQRPSGLTQRRLPLPFMRATNVQFSTVFPRGYCRCCAINEVAPKVNHSLCVRHFYLNSTLNCLQTICAAIRPVNTAAGSPPGGIIRCPAK